MELTDQDLAEFQKAYEEAFNESITESEARAMASRVLRLYELLATPLPEGREPLDEKASPR